MGGILKGFPFQERTVIQMGGGAVQLVEAQGESNMHQIVVTILCRLHPPFPQGELALFRYRKTPFRLFCEFYRFSCMNPLFPLSAPKSRDFLRLRR